LAICSTAYSQFFSDKAKIIRILKDQIEQQDQVIKQLQLKYAVLLKEEQIRLEEIYKLKDKLASIQEKINSKGAKIHEIKNEIISIDSALSIIEGYTHSAVAHSLDILHSDSSGTRK
jgi:chromosome segregation ATPase